MICDRLFLYEHQSTKKKSKHATSQSVVCGRSLLGADKRHVFVWGTSGSNPGVSFCGILQRRTENGGSDPFFACLIFIAPRTEHPYLELETLVLNINKGL